jgi:trehalose 6-phosphate synthase
VKAADGSLEARAAGGGLAPSLATALAGTEGATWIAAAMSEADREGAAAGPIATGQAGLTLRLVAVEPAILRAAYDTVANGTLWFTLHGLFDAARRPLFDRVWYEAWDAFVAYNEAFAAATADTAGDGSVVLVNDYHLLLAGRLIAKERPDLPTVHFMHTPFSGPEELGILPPAVRRQILDGMAGFGACGFHTARWAARFERSAVAELGEAPPTYVAPLGADLARLEEVAGSPECAARLASLNEALAGRRLILRSDRVELSKNMLRGFLGLDHLLSEHPEWRGQVVMVARAYPSREGLPEYLAYRSEAEHLARLVNDRWATDDWEPIQLVVGDDFPGTVAALRRYDVLLVNPIRDGMNLVAKEGPALNERDGVLVLSTEAGAYEDLEGPAVGVHPFDVVATAGALHQALSMPADERAERAAELRRRATTLPPAEWLARVLAEAR